MKERPILFNGEMVRAILEDSKTQTRRLVKPQPTTEIIYDPYLAIVRTKYPDTNTIKCPYGKPGDWLWVRETFCLSTNFENRKEHKIIYKADHEDWYDFGWKPSIHMPRIACRILLEIISVRVEHLQKISNFDAEAEGVIPSSPNDWPISEQAYVGAFAKLWDSINGSESWNKNPWVWVIEFKKRMLKC